MIVDLAEDATFVVALRSGHVLAHSKDLDERGAQRLFADDEVEHLEVDRIAQQFADDVAAHFVAHKDGQLIDCNDAFVNLFGFASQQAAIASSFFERFPHETACRAFRSALDAHGRIRQQPVVLRACDGSEIHAVQNIVLRGDREGNGGVLRGYLLDQTEERRLARELQRAQRLEAIGRLAGGVAHDFNNLLTVILGYVSAVETRVGDRDRTMLAEARRAAERAAELTGRLLAFGRRQTLQLTALDVDTLLTGMLPLAQSLCGELVEIDTSLQSAGLTVRGDAGQLERAVMNLIVNARDAMPGGGRLRVRSSPFHPDADFRVEHPWAKAPSYVRIEVSDTGVGMSPNTLEHVFEPFYTTKALGEGTGLGLPAAQGIVEQHDGAIEVQSAQGRGTMVSMYLPADADASAARQPTQRDPLQGGSEKILIAEDEPMVRRALAQSLRSRGYQVLEAERGDQALQFALQGDLDLIVLDVVMPGLSGVSAYQRIRATHPRLPILLTSGYSDEEPSLQLSQDPNGYFIPKPYSPETMLRLVRRALDFFARGSASS